MIRSNKIRRWIGDRLAASGVTSHHNERSGIYRSNCCLLIITLLTNNPDDTNGGK